MTMAYSIMPASEVGLVSTLTPVLVVLLSQRWLGEQNQNSGWIGHLLLGAGQCTLFPFPDQLSEVSQESAKLGIAYPSR